MLPNAIVLTVIASTLLILLLIAVVVITVFAANKRNVQQEMKLSQLQLDHEKGLRELQEQVMTNVARELHDNIGQRLTFMNLQLEQQKAVTPAMIPGLQPVSEMMVNTMQEVRALGRSLNSDLIEKNDLVYTIGQEVSRLQQLGIYEVQWVHDPEPQLDKDRKVIVFRIFQEVLNNMLKHAEAKNIYISVRGAGGFSMVVKDDGKGFDADEMMRTAKGAGLKNILKRAELAKLSCRIESTPKTAGGKGTTFTLEQITS